MPAVSDGRTDLRRVAVACGGPGLPGLLRDGERQGDIRHHLPAPKGGPHTTHHPAVVLSCDSLVFAVRFLPSVG